MTESVKQRRRKRFAHVQNPEPSRGHYAEVKDLVKRVDPEDGVVTFERGKGPQRGGGSWCVRMGGREALFPFLHGCAFEQLYKGYSRHTGSGAKLVNAG